MSWRLCALHCSGFEAYIKGGGLALVGTCCMHSFFQARDSQKHVYPLLHQSRDRSRKGATHCERRTLNLGNYQILLVIFALDLQ